MSIYNHHNTFFPTKYQHWYYSIIEKAISQDRNRNSDSYYEAHHVLPQSIFPDYKKEKWNIVLLTAKEHFICHWLLIKMTTGNEHYKMYKALHKMLQNGNGKRIFTSLEYETARKYNSLYMIENNPSKRPEVRKKMAAAKLGTTLPKKTREKMSKNNARYWQDKEGVYKGSKFYNNGQIQKMFYPEQVPEGWVPGRLNAPWNKKS